MTNKERLNELYKKFNLTADDIFRSPQGWTIITRGGIDKIQAASGIVIKYKIQTTDLGNIIILAKGKSEEGNYIETFGEASAKNTKNGYPVAIAEKRAMSRVVLKLAGFYELGVFGEDEWDDASKEANNHRKSQVEKESPKGFDIPKKEEINDDLDFDTL